MQAHSRHSGVSSMQLQRQQQRGSAHCSCRHPQRVLGRVARRQPVPGRLGGQWEEAAAGGAAGCSAQGMSKEAAAAEAVVQGAKQLSN